MSSRSPSSGSDIENGGHRYESDETRVGVREQDRLLPIANVGRIMKKELPGNAKISKEAKQTMQECVSEFISFVTGEASDRCHKEKRKTINGDDVLFAMSTLGFDDYTHPLNVYLHRFREIEGEKLSLSKFDPPLQNATNPNPNVSSSSSLPFKLPLLPIPPHTKK